MTNFDKIKRGDLIFTRSSDWTGKVIRFVTRSEINHVALYIGNGIIIESQLGYGVRQYKLIDYMKDQKIQVYHGVLKSVPKQMVDEVIKEADRLLNSPYDLLGQIGILFKVLITRIGLGGIVHFYGRNITQSDKAWWCSEIIAYCFEKKAIKITRSDQRYATPEDLAVSDNIEFKILR